MISETIELIKVLEKEGFTRQESLKIIEIQELKNIKEILNGFSNNK